MPTQQQNMTPRIEIVRRRILSLVLCSWTVRLLLRGECTSNCSGRRSLLLEGYEVT